MTTQNNNTPATQQAPPATQLPAVLEKTIADSVMNKIKLFQETGTVSIPKDYSAPNALRVAWLIILETKTPDKRPVTDACTKESIANALLKMVIQGLNPVKGQCAFIAYGNQLTMQREYQGTIAIAKRDANLDRVVGNAIYKDDVFEYTIDPATGVKTITKHSQTIESMGGSVKGAYAVKHYKDGRIETEIMPMNQIQAAWQQGPTKGESPAHKKFPDQMAIKTVINRALKIDINSSDDSALMDDGIAEGGDDVRVAAVKQEIEDSGNKIEIGFTSDQPAANNEQQADAVVVTPSQPENVNAQTKPAAPF